MAQLTVAESLEVFSKWLQRILFINVVYLLLMSVFRVATLMIYGQKSNWTADLLNAFWMGIRFDSTVLGYYAVIPALLLIVALHVRRQGLYDLTGKFLKAYYIFFFFLTAVLLAINVQYYSYFQDHFNILVFGLFEDDTLALLATFWKNYPVVWYFVFAALGLYALIQLVSFGLQKPQLIRKPDRMHFGVLPLVSLVVLVLVFMIGRGSFGLFPLGPADTVISKDPFVNHLSSNGMHGLFRAIKLRQKQNTAWDMNMKYFGYGEARQAFADYFQIPPEQVPENPLDLFRRRTPKNEWAEQTQPHVVVFMMESFGGHWLKYHSENFNLLGEFEKHTREDILLKNFLPASGSTIGSLSSIMISAPQRPLGNFLTESEFLQVPFRSSPARVFSKAGYETHFIYGGTPGWRDMNKFARYQGFDHVEGDVDIQARIGAFKETHDWGIYDEDVFRYVMTLLKEAKKPKFLLVMTTTNHPPYQLPSDFKVPPQKIPDHMLPRLIGDREIIDARFKTFYYSNQKLGEFMSQLKESPLGEKTLVTATGDHSFLLVNYTDEELLKKWSVPLYLYTPKALDVSLPADTFGSHMDIFPTLYSLALSETEYEALGVNLLDPQAPRYALHSSQLIVGPQGGVFFGNKEPSFFQWSGTYEKLVPASADPEKTQMATRYRALMSLMDYYLMTEKKSRKN